MVTWPSAISTTLLSLRTHKTVVPCICALSALFCIRPLYNLDGLGQKQRRLRRASTRGGSQASHERLSHERLSCLLLFLSSSLLWTCGCRLFGSAGQARLC